MALYALGDLHLSLNSNKSMEIFGDGWQDYVSRLKDAFSALGPEDVTVLCGDLSWGMSLEESLEDFRFIDALPGKKYLLKGNHDYWWNTAAKMERFFREHELTTMEILHNNCWPCAAPVGGFTSWTTRGPTTKRCCCGRSGGWRAP